MGPNRSASLGRKQRGSLAWQVWRDRLAAALSPLSMAVEISSPRSATVAAAAAAATASDKDDDSASTID